jgi:hypothetical protein
MAAVIINYSRMCDLVVAGNDALLVVAGRLVVGVDDGVRGDAVGVVRLSPGVDGVDVRNVLEHGATEESEHFAARSHGNMKVSEVDKIFKYEISISDLQSNSVRTLQTP